MFIHNRRVTSWPTKSGYDDDTGDAIETYVPLCKRIVFGSHRIEGVGEHSNGNTLTFNSDSEE